MAYRRTTRKTKRPASRRRAGGYRRSTARRSVRRVSKRAASKRVVHTVKLEIHQAPAPQASLEAAMDQLRKPLPAPKPARF